MTIHVNYDRFYQSIDDISKFCLSDKLWTRRSFTPMYQKGRDWFAEQTKAAGANVYYDVAGNLISRFEGSGKSDKTIVIGSHLDTVPSGGRFDGIMGVLAGLEIAKTLKEHDIKLDHHLEVVDFLAEEPSEFGISCIGSRALAGRLSDEKLGFTDPEGRILKDAINEYKGDSSQLAEGKILRDDIACFLEYHIEQGRVLEDKQIDIGVVTSIVGLSKLRIELTGQSNHAGTTPMDIRKDAMVCLSDLVLGATQKAKDLGKETGAYLVATAGKVNLFPNATNVIAGHAEVYFDIRSDDTEVQDRFIDWLESYTKEIASKYGNDILVYKFSDSVLAKCNSDLVDLFANSAAELGYSYLKMPSGAGHDCAFMTEITPSAMIFCPSQNGLSHSPNEYSDKIWVGKGCDVLLNTLINADKKFL